jgi:hypothetical protein
MQTNNPQTFPQSPSIVESLGFVVESIKELVGA